MDNKALFNISRVGFDPAESAACIGELSKKVEELQAENARLVQEHSALLQQAEIQAQEARTQKAIRIQLLELLGLRVHDYHCVEIAKKTLAKSDLLSGAKYITEAADTLYKSGEGYASDCIWLNDYANQLTKQAEGLK